MKKHLNNPVFKTISRVVSENNTAAYVVGGFVRDALLNRNYHDMDIDIVVLGSGIEMAKKVAEQLKKGTKVTVFKNFGTAMFKYKGYEIEFVGARKESYRSDSRKPIVENGTLEDDQQRRDFTINAMAICLHPQCYGELTDPFDGRSDLANKIIRTPRDPDITFSDDPLRMIRAIRFAAQLNFVIEDATLKAISDNCGRIKIVSKERMVAELNKIILTDTPSAGFNLLESTGLLALLFPALQNMKGVETVNHQQHKDNYYHTIKVLDNLSKVSDDLWLRWAAVLHDIGKPETKKFIPGQGWTFHGHNFIGAKMVPEIFRQLKLPLGEKMKYVQKLVQLHLRPIALVQDEVTDSAIRRLLYDAGNNIDDLMTLCEADITSKNEEKVKTYLKNFRTVRKKLIELEEKDALRNFQPPVSGTEIIDTFKIPPSRKVGIIKTAIKDAILDGEISNNHEEAYDFMIKKGKELGLEPHSK